MTTTGLLLYLKGYTMHHRLRGSAALL